MRQLFFHSLEDRQKYNAEMWMVYLSLILYIVQPERIPSSVDYSLTLSALYCVKRPKPVCEKYSRILYNAKGI